MSRTLQELTEELLRLTKDWNNSSIVPNDERKKVRAVGEEINKLGGLTAMQDAYRAAKQKNRAAVPVQAFWDRVGAWRW